MTTAVCFDLDGTLLTYDRPYDALVRAAVEEHLGTVTDAAVAAYDDAFLAAFEGLDAEPYHAGVRGVLDHAATSAAFDDAVVAGTEVDAMVATLLDREVEATSVSAAARDCLDALAADPDVRVAVVTDGVGDWQREKLARHGLADAVAETVVSYDVGGHKVDGAPYEAVRERLDADEYVMVGDDYESDVEAARAAGFVPVHYEDDGPDLFAVLRAFL